MHFLEIIKQQLFWKAVKYKAMYGVFFVLSKLKLYYLWKMHGYPKFSFWIPKALAKFCFPQIVLTCAKNNIPVLVSITHRKPEYLEMCRTYAQ